MLDIVVTFPFSAALLLITAPLAWGFGMSPLLFDRKFDIRVL